MQHAKKLIVGNWKMHGDAGMAHALTEEIISRAAKSAAEVVLCPPATLMHIVARTMIGSKIHLGAQDCSHEASGVHTGDISAAMLAEAGCSYVIVGHSERRQQCGETDALVKAKAEQALSARLTPIICVGETLAQRQSGAAYNIVSDQLKHSLPANGQKSHFVLAYEPVWAIGSGQTPSTDDIRAMHAHISSQIPEGTQVLYGGSVKAANSAEILTIPGVSGVLVGGASLSADEFGKIITSATRSEG